ncbi:hypothetical protein F5Y04DRAFT_286994 [Hypomontagnella monticulosa]|nr:hypothetical protein F5Y04DRAFT_286994 [Hypomontagnella monticulosa]
MTRHDLDYAGRRLQLVGSRVVEPEKSGSGSRVLPTHQHHHQHSRVHSQDEFEESNSEKGSRDTPKFLKTEAASNFELFYDLWFVANLNVFTSIHDISDLEKFNSFIGYMVLLWTTWLLTTLYDVRFTADSVWERCCKAVHLGVMIGFAEIGTNFDPNNQLVSVFRTMSLFLAVSRFILFLQYGLVAFQIRKYADGPRPMFFTAFLHLCASAIYFGVSFRYDLGKSSRVFLVWYIGGVVEMSLHLSLSQLSHVLTFVGTHLGERLNLLTLVILGEGCIILAKSITLLVKDTFVKDANYTIWSGTLIGLVTAGTALIYIIFQLYFDWMHDEHSMSKRHQVWWTSLHLPFHIALVLLLEGTSQFVVWARIIESTDAAIAKVLSTMSKINEEYTSEDIADLLAGVVKPFLKKYPPADVLETWKSVNETLEHIADIPDSFWDSDPSPDDSTLVHYKSDLVELMNTMINAVYNAFGIEPPEDVESTTQSEYWQSEAAIATVSRFILVYIYAFACAGIVLLFLTIMHVISKRKGWSPFNIFRTAICICLSIVLALLTIVAADKQAVLKQDPHTAFFGSSWMLPTIAISYFIVLVMTHLPHPSGFCLGNFRRGTYKEVEAARDPKERHALTSMSRNNQHIADYEDRRTGYSSGHPDALSPPLPGYHQHEAMPLSASEMRSHERRSRNSSSRSQRHR